MGLSLNPAKADASGGLFDGKIVTIIGSMFKTTTYNGRHPETTVWELVFQDENGNAMNPQFFSCGSASLRLPSKDGKSPAKDKEGPFLVPLKEKLEGVGNDCRAYEMACSMKDVGVPAAIGDDGDSRKFIGLKIRLGSVVTKDIRGNVLKTKDKDGKEYDKKHPICTELISMPGEGKAQSATQSAVSAAASEDDQTAAQMLVASLVAENGELKKAMIASKGLQALKAEGAMDQPSMQRVIKLAMSNDFLEAGSNDGLWSFDQGVVKSV